MATWAPAWLSDGEDELSAMEAALNQTAERLGDSFAEIENRRHELAAMLDSMQEAVVAITPEGLVRWSNAVMQRITGTLFILAGRWYILCATLRCWSASARRSISAKSALAAPILWLRAAPLRSTPRPLPSGGALVVLHDVTAIEAAEKSRRDFIANVSHELRTPLTSIQGYVETLVEEPLSRPETTREFLGVILKNASAHEPAHRGSAGPGQRGKPRLQAGAAAYPRHRPGSGCNRIPARNRGRLRGQAAIGRRAGLAGPWPIPTP